MVKRSVFVERGLMLVLMLLCGLAALTVHAPPAQAAYNPPYAAFVIDVKTGEVLHAENADARRYPASLTKVMTLYMLFEQLESGRLQLDSRLRVSARAAAEPPSKIGVRAGSTIAVEDAILALVTKSANDVAAVVAENLGGSVENFARQMTERARQIGMSNTTFRNPHGLPNNGQVTTARDMATLAIAIQDRFPQYYTYFQRRSFSFAGQSFRNHNRLLGRVEGVDGIKTGFIRASGFNLMTNAKANGRHIVTIVMGGRSGAHRDGIVERLVERWLPRAYAGARRTAPITGPNGTVMAILPPQRPSDLVPPVLVASAAPGQPLDLTRMRPAVATAAGASTVTPGSLRADAGVVPAAASAFAAVRPPAGLPGGVPLPPAPIPEVVETASVTSAAVAAPVPPMPTRSEAPVAADAPVGATQPPAVQSAPIQVASADAAVPLPVEAPAPRSYALTEWVIQIAATPTEDAAFDLLQRAQSRVGGSLDAAAPFTEEIVSNGATLFRARFTGFDDADKARGACRELENKGFDCFAIRS
ncbi:D-alanyl-D-alanine carboxypeptidase [Salinarimonas ramus]|uniref:Penicillin-binding protein n=1 Tax=Salinarimonas ramus TaxID=690164 RepID=A0A917QAH8_9HYPH|nr:D-alanyl-D-alanine carboxypeptidase [Salinarimonas ramus]GGK39937.1 penicillin-binding protein [Salinarimonas ramus]